MIWSIISEGEIFLQASNSCAVPTCSSIRSSNPYDYLRRGYYVDGASMFGGKNIVDYNSDIPGNRPGFNLYFSLV